MKFSLWTNYGALNSRPVFNAFDTGASNLGHAVTYNDPNSDVDVIWSVLWNGRMAPNQAIWKRNQAQRKPTVVLEVGGIRRGTTWKVGLNGINRAAYFGTMGFDNSRAAALGLSLNPWRTSGSHILVCGQHERSLQWEDMPRMSEWISHTIEAIRKHTNRTIVFRPHPRCRLPHIEQEFKNVFRQNPVKLNGTYDDFDIKFNDVWATVSWSSNPGVHSIINGVPAFVGPQSLAYDVANDMGNLHTIENPLMPDRTQWLNDYAWTEFTLEEIASGLPLKRLTDKL